MRIDEIDPGQVPARVAQVHHGQRVVARRDLEALPVQGHGTVGAPLASWHLDAKRVGEHRGGGTVAAHVGAGQIARERRGADLAVQRAVILLLDPGLGRLIEQFERERGLALEHGHQPSLDAAPEGLLLGVLIRRVRQRRLVQYRQAVQARHRLVGEHGRAVVGHQRARQPALHEGLGQTMDQALRALVQVPLQVADQARTIVQDAQQEGLLPGARAGKHATRAVVEVQVPQRRDMIELEAAHLAVLEPVAREHRARARALGRRLAEHPLGLEVAAYRRVGRHAQPSAGECCAQIVHVQLRGPARVLAVLLHQGVDDARRKTREAASGAWPVAQRRDRVGGAARGVVPALDRRQPEAYVLAADGMAPGAGGERGQRTVHLARRGRCGQQGADDREAQPRPAIALRGIGRCAQEVLPVRAHRGGGATGSAGYEASASVAICILCGNSAPLGQRDRAHRERRQKAQQPLQRLGGLAGKAREQLARQPLGRHRGHEAGAQRLP